MSWKLHHKNSVSISGELLHKRNNERMIPLTYTHNIQLICIYEAIFISLCSSTAGLLWTGLCQNIQEQMGYGNIMCEPCVSIRAQTQDIGLFFAAGHDGHFNTHSLFTVRCR